MADSAASSASAIARRKAEPLPDTVSNAPALFPRPHRGALALNREIKLDSSLPAQTFHDYEQMRPANFHVDIGLQSHYQYTHRVGGSARSALYTSATRPLHEMRG
jgi:hypothetical protein